MINKNVESDGDVPIKRMKIEKIIQRIRKIGKKYVKYIHENVSTDKIIVNKYSLSVSCVL